MIIDGGKFDWKASGKYPWISEPNSSYHGLAFCDAAGAAAFVTYIRAILLRDTGSTLSPFHAFLFLQGLETLSLRVERHVFNALKIVEYLRDHPQVEAVHHPSLNTEPSHALYEKYLPIIGDGRVSKLHCAIIHRGDKLYLKDEGSRNGTYLNGERIDRPVVIQRDDIIGIGETRLEVQRILRESES